MNENHDPQSPDASGELVAGDDTIIKRALLVSLAALVLIGGAVGGFVLFLQRETPEEPVEETPLVLPETQRMDADPPAVRFVDVTAESGIDFVHENGARGEKLLPETMGAGCAFADFDLDGDPDLVLVNGAPWPHDRDATSDAPPTLALYENDGAGGFTDVTSARGLDVSLYGVGVAVGDVDGDRDPDLFVTCVGTNRLFRNDGDAFVDVTAEAGLAGEADAWSTSAGFFDAENDGDLDLFVCNYVRWTREIDIALDFRLVGVGRAYGPPTNFEGTQPYFYVNDGSGKFAEKGEACGFHVTNPATGGPVAKSLALVPLDADGDGWVDIFVANDTVRNFLYRNLGECRFEDIGIRAGLAYDAEGNSTGAMGVDVGHFRNDDALAIGVGNFAAEMSSFYVSRGGDLLFNDETITEGIGPVSRQMLSFGLFFFDYDLDGRLDLFQTNGHLEEEINEVQASQHYRQPSQLFWNNGDGHPTAFTPVSIETTGDLGKPVVGRAAAYADIDSDGDLDLIITQTAEAPLLLRNEQETGHHWVRLRLEGAGGNTAAIGASVELVAGGRVQRRRVMPTRSYLSQVEPVVTFGLDGATAIEVVRVRWPGASAPQEFRDLEIDRVHTLSAR